MWDTDYTELLKQLLYVESCPAVLVADSLVLAQVRKRGRVVKRRARRPALLLLLLLLLRLLPRRKSIAAAEPARAAILAIQGGAAQAVAAERKPSAGKRVKMVAVAVAVADTKERPLLSIEKQTAF
jgi:hypothetical protein